MSSRLVSSSPLNSGSQAPSVVPSCPDSIALANIYPSSADLSSSYSELPSLQPAQTSDSLGAATSPPYIPLQDVRAGFGSSIIAVASPVPVGDNFDQATEARGDTPQLLKQLSRPREPTTRGLFIGTSGERERSSADVRFSQRVFEKCFKSVGPNNIRTHLGKGRVDHLDWLFSPDNVVPGDMLILLITGHATLDISQGTVTFEFETREGMPVDTFVLQSMINKLPEYCTLEIVIGTCHSEAAVLGLHRTWVADSSKVVDSSIFLTTVLGPAKAHESLLGRGLRQLPSNPPAKGALPAVNVPTSRLLHGTVTHLATKATVIVWAAALTNEYAYTEASLPGQKGKYCAMIGAMFRTLVSEGGKVTRRTLCARIGRAAKLQQTAREERDRTKTAGGPRLWGPRIQTPLLLSSVDAPNRVLDGYAFQPL